MKMVRELLGVLVIWGLLFWAGVAGGQVSGYGLGSQDDYPSFLEAEQIAVLSSAVDGIVSDVNYVPQDFVKAGAVIIQQDTQEMELKIAGTEVRLADDTTVGKAEVRLEYSSENLEIVKKLYETHVGEMRVGTKKEFQEARQAKMLAELDLQQAKLEKKLLEYDLAFSKKILEKHSVVSPFDGVIVEFSSVRTLEDRGLKKVAVGEMLRAGQLVAAVMKVERLRVSTDLPVEMLDSIKLGQKAQVYVQGSEEPVDAMVVYKSPTANSATMQFRIEVELANIPVVGGDVGKGAYIYKFRPGLRARIELTQ